MDNDNERINLFLFLYRRKAFDESTALPLSECPIKGVDLKAESRTRRIKIKNEKIYLCSLGKSVAVGEMLLRNREKEQDGDIE